MGLGNSFREFFSRLAKRFSGKERLSPEAEYQVEVTDEIVRVVDPDGSVEEVTWAELSGFDIETNELGPYAPEVFWVLHGDGRGCIIPMGATGDKALLERLYELPGFDEENYSEAMSSTSQASFQVWRKPVEQGHSKI